MSSSNTLTPATALSTAAEALPPRLMDAIEGRPDARAEFRTKFMPEMLFAKSAHILDAHRIVHTYRKKDRT